MKTFFKKERLEKAGTPIPEKTRLAIWERCGGRCEHCGKKAVDAHHIIPRSAGGSNDINNLIALCRACHDEPVILNKIAKNKYLYLGRYKW